MFSRKNSKDVLASDLLVRTAETSAFITDSSQSLTTMTMREGDTAAAHLEARRELVSDRGYRLES